MRRARRCRALALVALVAGLAAPAARAEENPSAGQVIEDSLANETLTLDLDQVGLPEAIRTLQDAVWLNIVLDHQVPPQEEPVDVEVERAPLGDVLEAILAGRDLVQTVWCDVLYIHPTDLPPAPDPDVELEGDLPGYTVNLLDSGVGDALEFLRDLSGLEFAYAPSAERRLEERTVSLRLRNLPLHHVLTLITYRVGLTWSLRGETVVFEGPPGEGAAGADPLLDEVRVSLVLEATPLPDAARALAEAAGVEVRLPADAPPHEVSLELEQAPLREALDALVAGSGLGWRRDGDAVEVLSGPGKW